MEEVKDCVRDLGDCCIQPTFGQTNRLATYYHFR